MGNNRKALSVLIVSTLAFTVCFMVWMMFGVIGIPIKKTLGLNATEFGLLTATPVLTGSLIRVPLGIWTDKYGGRIVMAMLMAITVPAIWLMSYATAYWHFLVIGLFVGLAGGSFSVGTPYVARWFPRNRQGFAMGVYGAGNSGAAVNKFVAPALVVAFGWTMVPQVYAAIMLGTLVLFWMFSASDPAHLVPSHTKFSDQLKMLKDPKVHQVLPVLQHRLRRLRGAVAVDGAVLRRRVRPGHPRRGAAGGLLLAARRRAARGRRLAVRQVRRAPGHLVGDVGQLDLPVPAELPADRHDDPDRRRAEDLPASA